MNRRRKGQYNEDTNTNRRRDPQTNKQTNDENVKVSFVATIERTRGGASPFHSRVHVDVIKY